MRHLTLLLCLSLTACVWQPLSFDRRAQAELQAAESAFRSEPALKGYFDEAVAWAVFPGAWRAGAGFGAGLATGWLVERGEVTGRTLMVELAVGANVGAQAYRSILFFRNAVALDKFRRGRFEFTGQAYATAVTASAAITPSYNGDVALFVAVKGGLLLEASVGSQRYDYFPLPAEQ